MFERYLVWFDLVFLVDFLFVNCVFRWGIKMSGLGSLVLVMKLVEVVIDDMRFVLVIFC